MAQLVVGDAETPRAAATLRLRRSTVRKLENAGRGSVETLGRLSEDRGVHHLAWRYEQLPAGQALHEDLGGGEV